MDPKQHNSLSIKCYTINLGIIGFGRIKKTASIAKNFGMKTIVLQEKIISNC